MEIPETTFDGGRVQQGETLTAVFTVRNTGTGALGIVATPG